MRRGPSGEVKQTETQRARQRGKGVRQSKRGESTTAAGLAPYMQSIRYQKLLSVTEEARLAEAIARGDQDALNQLIECNLKLVVKLAGEHTGQGVTLDDLISEGNMGLMRAATQYRAEHEVRFSTYAGVWIQKSMRRAILTSSALIRLPSYMVDLLYKWKRAERSLARELGYPPSSHEVAQVLGLSELQQKHLEQARAVHKVQQESTVKREKGGWSSADAIDPYGPPELAEETLDDDMVVSSRLHSLDEAERLVLTLRLGLGREAPMKLSAIADLLGRTKEGVRQIEIQAAKKLRRDESPGTSGSDGWTLKKSRRRGARLRPRRGRPPTRELTAATGRRAPVVEVGEPAREAASIPPPRRIPPAYLMDVSPKF